MRGSAEEIHAAVRTGALRSLEGPIGSLAKLRTPQAEAWGQAIAAARHLVAGAEPPALEAVERWEGAEVAVRSPALLACAHLERAALLTWDAERLSRLRAVQKRLAEGLVEGPRHVARAEAWMRLLAGDVDDLEAIGKELYAEAAAAQDASLVIDATLLRAMAALTRGDHGAARGLARRASRMARTEGLRAERFLAAIVLARVRRRGGRPHLATRIASAIGPVAPPVVQGWLVWERLLAGWRPTAARQDSEASLASAPDAPAVRGARGLIAWLEAAGAGDRAAFDRWGAAVQAATRGFADIAREATALSAALDPDLGVEALPASVQPWARGDDDDTPAGLHGIVGPPDGPADSTIASVVCHPERSPRRVLRLATALLQRDGPVARLARTRLRRGRVDTAIAALALAGTQGLADAALFERVYEFEFVPSLHAGVLDVLVHRMRARVGDAATIRRAPERLWLEPRRVLVLPDPRCVEHVEERLLRVLARHGGLTTRQAAEELDVSVRTAQLALRRLLSSGDCVLNRDGRRVRYLVEDTTFTEPTRY